MTEKSTTDVATVLLVEDDDLTLKLLSSILSKFSYHLPSQLIAPKQLRPINDRHPDVIVCDLHLPNGNGLVVLRHAISTAARRARDCADGRYGDRAGC